VGVPSNGAARPSRGPAFSAGPVRSSSEVPRNGEVGCISISLNDGACGAPEQRAHRIDPGPGLVLHPKGLVRHGRPSPSCETLADPRRLLDGSRRRRRLSFDCPQMHARPLSGRQCKAVSGLASSDGELQMVCGSNGRPLFSGPGQDVAYLNSKFGLTPEEASRDLAAAREKP
jgi:hypothetical protein